MRETCLLALLAIAGVLNAQPKFTAHQVGAATGGRNGWLWPEEVYSVYGRDLGPEQACERDAGGYRPQGPNRAGEYDRLRMSLPTELCGVVVMLEEERLPLVYVQAKQVNFLVPRLETKERVKLRVVYGEKSSSTVELKFGPDRIGISQDGEALTGMPVWVRVRNLSDPKRAMQLPLGTSSFAALPDCPHVEVQFAGVLQRQREGVNPPRHGIALSGNPCPGPPLPENRSLAGRVPLHLQYRFDQPGTYRVRYVPRSSRYGGMSGEAPSEWLTVQVKPGSEAMRTKWLADRLAATPTDAEELAYDFLPSVFGFGDAAALRIGLNYLYHSDPSVAAAAAAYLFKYYPAAVLVPELEQTVRFKGPNERATRLLEGTRDGTLFIP